MKSRNLKGVLALVLAIMVFAMSVPAFAAVPANGSITVNSPIVGATYSIYKIFDMKVNDDVTAFSYTIKGDSPFYKAVNDYANMPNAGATTEDSNTDGLTLKVTADTADKADADKVYNVIVDVEKFDAQDFGQKMLEVVSDAMKTTETSDDIEKAANDITVTVNETEDNSQRIKFEGLDLGYFLITSEYPKADYSTVTMTVKKYDGTPKDDPAVQYTFNKDSLEDPKAENLTLKAEAKTQIEQYVNAVVTDDYVAAYITDKDLKDKDVNENEIAIEKDSPRWAEVKQEIIDSMKEDAEKQILGALKNSLEGSESDINLAHEPILVFLDSSKPDATINEKNEIDKWDVPVNPSGDALPKDIPDHGEPKGGKNLVIKEATATTSAVYADWTEANIGDSVHYQLRVNAMNFVREFATGDLANQATANKVEQVKAYNLLDYQSAQMHFDTDKKLRVTIVNDKGENITNTDAVVNPKYVGTSENVINKEQTTYFEKYYDYTSVANKFFVNNSDPNKDGSYIVGKSDEDGQDIFKDGSSNGIVVPWVKISKEDLSATYPVYTTNEIPKIENGQPVYKTETVKTDDSGAKIPVKDADGNNVSGQFVSVNGHIVDADGNLLDANGQKIQDTEKVFIYSLYNSDVTIVVDYWMILDDDAIIDEPGNVNFSQYGYSKVERVDQSGTPVTPTTPDDNTEPDEKREVDEATVYTYAIAWVKVNNQAEPLAGAKFQLPFYVKATKDTGSNSYVYAMTTKEYDDSTDAEKATKYTNEVTTTVTDDNKAVITIKGVKSGKYSITETEAPVGYNKLDKPFELEAKKSGGSVTTKTETTIKLDANGNITEKTAVTTVTFNTDKDTQVAHVPVYQFNPVVNNQGAELPATGGIGTTIFYVTGSILVLAAAILLITKRRMNVND